ncbi:RNA 3'-terminal phosphate cyclase domain-containing protein [Phaeosphaeriaceae sp. PMI808]|nr:RNA 3'-terminal phosphate cyclase domain-containing protein [Phaeosphaeriaceae sp. PMI808]
MAPKVKLPTPIHLEGTTLEGGGQLLRLALGLSSLTKKPINITNIRGNRSGGGGLKAQHLTSVQWLGQASNARLSGVGLKSKEITFAPKQDSNKTSSLSPEGYEGVIRITQNTPGAINLVFQAILPYLLFSPSPSPINLHITGGTNVSNSPSHEYISEVLIPTLSLIGIPHITTHLHSRGWSQGTTRLGSISYTITPLSKPLPAFHLLRRGPITHIKAIVIAPADSKHAFQNELQHWFESRAPGFFGNQDTHVDFDVSFESSLHEKRYYLLMIATTSCGAKLGRDWLFDRAVRPDRTAQIVSAMVGKVGKDLRVEIEHGGCVDEFARDQLVVFQALAEGRSEVFGGVGVEMSLHARTAVWVAGEVIGVRFDEEGSCEGVGFWAGRGGEGNGEEEVIKRLEGLEVSSS